MMQSPYQRASLPPGLKILLIATVVTYIGQLLPTIGGLLFSLGALVPVRTFMHGEIWRLAGYLFLHSTAGTFPSHLLFNMLALWMFGMELEQMWGTRKFVLFYFICGIGSGLFNAFSLFSYRTAITPVIGASGAILGLLTAYAFYFPYRRILVFFLFPIQVRWAVIIFGAISLLFSFSSSSSISHLTHLGGIVVAVLYLKGYPTIEKLMEQYNEKRHEQKVRRQREEQVARDRLFQDEIDPVLKKISEQGMESLTPREKKILKKGAKKDPGRMKIVPFRKR